MSNKKDFKFDQVTFGNTSIKDITMYPPTVIQKRETLKKMGPSWMKVANNDDPSEEDYDRFYNGAMYIVEQAAKTSSGATLGEALVAKLPAWVVEEAAVFAISFTGK